MAIQLRSQPMPTDMTTRGRLQLPKAANIGTGGTGVGIHRIGRTGTWQWTRLNDAEFDYLSTTVLQGELSLECVGNETTTLNDPMQQRQEVDFLYAVIDAPDYEKYQSGYYWNVTLTIRQLIEA